MLLRFQREIDMGKRIEHPNVTRTLAGGEIDDVNFIAMEYVPGRSLQRIVGLGGRIPVGDAARIFAEVAAGLHHLHEQKIIHRDLKPANVMVMPTGGAKLLDLGLALGLGEPLPDDPRIVGGKGYILGTMDYIAPEQARNATDVGPHSRSLLARLRTLLRAQRHAAVPWRNIEGQDSPAADARAGAAPGHEPGREPEARACRLDADGEVAGRPPTLGRGGPRNVAPLRGPAAASGTPHGSRHGGRGGHPRNPARTLDR